MKSLLFLILLPMFSCIGTRQGAKKDDAIEMKPVAISFVKNVPAKRMVTSAEFGWIYTKLPFFLYIDADSTKYRLPVYLGKADTIWIKQ